MALQVASLGMKYNPGPANPLDLQGGTPFYNVGAQQAQAQQTYNEAAPSYDSGGGYSSGGGGGGGGGVSYSSAPAAPAPHPDLSSYDQGIGNIQSGIDRLGNQQNIAHQNVLDSYQSAYNTLLGQKNATEQTYNQNTATEGQNYVGNKNSINANVGSALNATQRLLGAHGAGGSSVALFNAPDAAARQGGLERNQAGQTFATNKQKLDQSWGQYQNDWRGSASDLQNQRDNNIRSADAQIENTRASLLQQLAQLKTQRGAAAGMTTAQAVAAGQPYINQANQSLSTVDNLGRNVGGVTPQQVLYHAPTLADYLASQHATAAVNPGQQTTDAVNPFLSTLLGKDKQQNQLLGVQ